MPQINENSWFFLFLLSFVFMLTFLVSTNFLSFKSKFSHLNSVKIHFYSIFY